MDYSEALDLTRGALTMVITVASPILLVGLCVGLSISLFQSITQLQEQTLTFVPKIVAMVVSASFFVPWISRRLLEYARDLLGESPF